ncbi:MAG: cytochrome b/b6 domain-containing protein [Zoogloeaceae bacterium]|jgi:cytochrome b|nr:cytochrome b/b6 domain-containing protein [Zoogloeaceae bacterium]
MQTVKVWDLPVRLFHWLLVASIAALFITGKMDDAIALHGKIGIFVVGLLVFRVLWGFIGSTYARFLQFFPTPARIFAYLKGEWRGLGHNPLGALSVFALLFLTALQTGLGLLAYDEISFHGPLSALVGDDLAVRFTGWHQTLAYVLLAFVGLHAASIVFYKFVQKHDLLLPMLTGRAEVPENAPLPPAKDGSIKSLLLALALAAFSLWAACGTWIAWIEPEAPLPAAVETPAW